METEVRAIIYGTVYLEKRRTQMIMEAYEMLSVMEPNKIMFWLLIVGNRLQGLSALSE